MRMVVKDAPDRLQELIDWGTKFDKNEEGDYDLGREGGHSQHRILHHTDITGAEIERALIAQVKSQSNIEIFEHHYAIDLITEHQAKKKPTKRHTKLSCFGAYVLNGKTLTVLITDAENRIGEIKPLLDKFSASMDKTTIGKVETDLPKSLKLVIKCKLFIFLNSFDSEESYPKTTSDCPLKSKNN